MSLWANKNREKVLSIIDEIDLLLSRIDCDSRFEWIEAKLFQFWFCCFRCSLTSIQWKRPFKMHFEMNETQTQNNVKLQVRRTMLFFVGRRHQSRVARQTMTKQRLRFVSFDRMSFAFDRDNKCEFVSLLVLKSVKHFVLVFASFVRIFFCLV